MTVPTRTELARILATIPYTALVEIAKELVEMNEDAELNRHPETVHGMAETLADWGEAQLESE